MTHPFKRTIAALALTTTMTSAVAYEIKFREVCALVKETDRTVKVKIESSYDLCSQKGWGCFGIVAIGVPTDLKIKGKIKLITSTPLATGNTYTLFLENMGAERRVFLYNLRYESFLAPSEVDYFLPMDGAFSDIGGTQSRELPRLCSGRAPDCLEFRRHDNQNSHTVTASVIYPSFQRELATCLR